MNNFAVKVRFKLFKGNASDRPCHPTLHERQPIFNFIVVLHSEQCSVGR